MDRLGIDRQALSPPPVMFCYWAEARANQAFARMQNEHVATIAAASATLHRDGDGPAARYRAGGRRAAALPRAARSAAVEIGSFPGGRDFDDPALLPFFEACAELDVAVFVHPANPLIGQDRLTKYYFPLIVGNPLETALAISKLIYGGVLERWPHLRIAFAHGGGAFPFTLARLDHGWKVRPEGPAAIRVRRASTPDASTSTR